MFFIECFYMFLLKIFIQQCIDPRHSGYIDLFFLDTKRSCVYFLPGFGIAKNGIIITDRILSFDLISKFFNGTTSMPHLQDLGVFRFTVTDYIIVIVDDDKLGSFIFDQLFQTIKEIFKITYYVLFKFDQIIMNIVFSFFF